MNLEYNEAVGEVLQVLQYTEKTLVDKIPKKLLEFWKKNAVIHSDLSIDTTQNMDQINLKPKSKALLGMIYRNYWCDAEERKIYDNILKQNERKFQDEARKIYNPDEIFKAKQQVDDDNIVEMQQDTGGNIIPYKENIFTKIIEKIKSLFKK